MILWFDRIVHGGLLSTVSISSSLTVNTWSSVCSFHTYKLESIHNVLEISPSLINLCVSASILLHLTLKCIFSLNIIPSFRVKVFSFRASRSPAQTTTMKHHDSCDITCYSISEWLTAWSHCCWFTHKESRIVLK